MIWQISIFHAHPDVFLILHKASFQDTRFKSWVHLPATSQEKTVDSVIDKLTQTAQLVCSSTEQENESSPAKTCLEKTPGEKFQTEPLSTVGDYSLL